MPQEERGNTLAQQQQRFWEERLRLLAGAEMLKTVLKRYSTASSRWLCGVALLSRFLISV